MKTLLIAVLVLPMISFCQLRTLQAVKTDQPIKIDGNLDDAAWQNIPAATDFITTSTVFGNPASKKTVVKITYDNSAVYIGAYLYDDPSKIKKGLTSRDVIERQNTDYINIGFDTYKDKQNGFLFQVTAAGVQGDAKLSGGASSANFLSQSGTVDRTWDAVWESKVSMKKDGWVAEIKIPFSAIRFSKSNLQNWGLQFTRFSRINNESSSWSPEDPSINGGINQWGTWAGIRDITPPLRLSFSPYLSSGVRFSPLSNSNVTEYLKSGGMDVKYGINESFTLDMTLIPDFAQLQSDNIILNLTPFEVKFDEYRPFFTEGTELFNKANLFYARRIGATPEGNYSVLALANDSPQYRIIKNPGITRLYNATKLSGRTKDNIGIGFLNAITAPMDAIVENTTNGSRTTFETEPLTNYNVIVLDKALKNRSSVTFTNTNVLRHGNSRNANVSGIDLSLFDKKNVHGLFLNGRYSKVWGKNGNKDGFRFDPRFSKISGKYQYNFAASVLSDNYDPNDLGFLSKNNQVIYGLGASYNEFTATKKFLSQRYSISINNSYLYSPFKFQSLNIDLKSFFYFKNFWDVTVDFFTQPVWSSDYFEPRTAGKVLKRPPVYFLTISGSSDSRKKAWYSYNYSYGESPLPNDPYYSVENGLRYRFNDKFQLSADVIISKDRGNWGFVFRDASGEPVIGERNVRTNTTVVTGNYNFNPKMNLSIRMRHYWSNVNYTGMFNLKDDGYWTDRPFVQGYDENFNTFNVDMFWTWDFLLGSRITFAWKNALGAAVNIDGITNNTYIKNFSRIFDYPHSNEVSLKVVYYLDYLSLKSSRGSRINKK